MSASAALAFTSASTTPRKSTLDSRHYYLENFEMVLAWLGGRYPDLLNQEERGFMRDFAALPVASRALFVRMTMRKGPLFRRNKLRYEEIGCTEIAAQPLLALGWVGHDPALGVEALCALLTKEELVCALQVPRAVAARPKAELLEWAACAHPGQREFSAWYPEDSLYELRTAALCDRFRLMFFGNLHQDWSEFVLSDLGVFQYENVAFTPASRAFQRRQDIDDYLHLHACRERFESEEPLAAIVADALRVAGDNDWVARRRGKLLFHIGQRHEQLEEWQEALRVYGLCGYPGARVRLIRVLEKTAQFDAACTLAQRAEAAPENEEELQQLARILPRLRRKLGGPAQPRRIRAAVPRLDLVLPLQQDLSVEEHVRDHLTAQGDGQAHYVENTLLNSLFGLLCWDAVFAAVPGAFFHPFHVGPADLHHVDFRARRGALFADCLSALESGRYAAIIRRNYRAKAGIQSPFVSWDWLPESLLDQALACLPPAHLAKWFERMLADIGANCAGYPDLVQFWPQQRRYRMIEVKGPGDRLQDNQVRLLDFCLAHGMPVAVCHVRWEQDA